MSKSSISKFDHNSLDRRKLDILFGSFEILSHTQENELKALNPQ